jgi:hypothetical protein
MEMVISRFFSCFQKPANLTKTVPYNKLLTNLACSSCTGEYWPLVVFVQTSGQYNSPVRPSYSDSRRLVFFLLKSVMSGLFNRVWYLSLMWKWTSIFDPWSITV